MQVAILGAGNIGIAIARGLRTRDDIEASNIVMTRRHPDGLAELSAEGFTTTTDNADAVRDADVAFVCVQPAQVEDLGRELAGKLDAKTIVVSVATGVEHSRIAGAFPGVVCCRAMPNTAIAIGESMTCVCRDGVPDDALALVTSLFESVGKAIVIDEQYMTPATALCACGVAFFLRAIRAASQGGIEIGFHAEEALEMAAQTARGAASLLLEKGRHPEREIDRVTTPMGCTIAGLNQMEHEGFSSALIRGIVASERKAEQLGS